MDASQMTQPTSEPRSRGGLFAALDRAPLTRRGTVFLLITSCLFALSWLSARLAESIFAVVPGAQDLRPAPILPPVSTGWIIGDMILAVAAGALAGAAVRRLRWLAGTAVIAIATAVSACVWYGIAHHGLPVSFGSSNLAYPQLHVGAVAAFRIAGVLVFGAVGGLLSPHFLRRIPLGLMACGMLAWVGIAVLFTALLQLAVALQGGVVSGGVWSAVNTLPYALAAIWMVRAGGGRGMWIAALIAGGPAIFRLLFGGISLPVGSHLVHLLNSAHLALEGVAAAAAGAWVAVVLFGMDRSRRLLRDTAIVIALIIAALILGWSIFWLI
jgi:hypothetical protein